MFDFGITTLSTLTDALTVDTEELTFKRDDLPLDPEALLEVCGCLVTVLPLRKKDFSVQLAHYTVKEFLMSERIKYGAATTFQILNDDVYIFSAKCFITYMVEEDYDGLCDFLESLNDQDERDVNDEYEPIVESGSLMAVAVKNWAPCFRSIESEASKRELALLVLNLFDVTRRHFKRWIKATLAISSIGSGWTGPQGAEICSTLSFLCSFDYLPAAQICWLEV